jgi:serine/threonine-protein kinase
VDPETAASQQLQQFVNDDRAYVNAQLAERWVPMLSSKHSTEPWTYDSEDGVSYDSVQTLREHQALRQKYGAKLLYAGDWSVFDGPNYWVTVAPFTFSDSGSVLTWCSSQGLDDDHCAAQWLSTTYGRSGTHAHNH